jgi:DNA invertase Pin-like site-specific DNA recombinase
MTADVDGSILVPGDVEAAIYPRVSSPSQVDGYSLDTQQQAMLDKAQQLGWRVRVGNVYRETFTGEALFERPLLTQLRQAIARGDVQALILYDVDRFARDPVWVELLTQFPLQKALRVGWR